MKLGRNGPQASQVSMELDLVSQRRSQKVCSTELSPLCDLAPSQSQEGRVESRPPRLFAQFPFTWAEPYWQQALPLKHEVSGFVQLHNILSRLQPGTADSHGSMTHADVHLEQHGGQPGTAWPLGLPELCNPAQSSRSRAFPLIPA